MITAQLINVGRNKVNLTVPCKDLDEVWDKCNGCLLSSEVELVPSKTPREFTVFVGGYRPVGSVKILDGDLIGLAAVDSYFDHE